MESRTDWKRSFADGKCFSAQEQLGGHLTAEGAVFRVWAPEAEGVSVVGSFNDWDVGAVPMADTGGGIWEAEVCGAKQYDLYKFAVRTKKGDICWKADPYAFWAEIRPGTSSRLYELGGYRWHDGEWMDYRRSHKVYDSPVNIYELHAGSWRKREDGEYLSYGQLTEQLVPYIKEMGFTHIELMPLTEYPLDASWGYQCTGYFAATARYGDPKGLMYLIDSCHEAGIGVIMDWVPAHFPKDAHGLGEFDGSRCYEHWNPVMGEQPEWGTKIFNFGRGEVRSFLISSAMFWLREFHIDGIRVDAVASMLYLDYSRQEGGWIPNKYGGKENLEAVEFLRLLNEAAFAYDDSILMIAEESTAWPGVTQPTYTGGLGFNLKWNMGWMNDILAYMKTDPCFRKGNHRALTFPLVYAFSENYILPISHDEVVHLKGSLWYKMPGDEKMKMAGVRAFWAYMLAHPGKKLIFMGAELGQENEWNFQTELPWEILEKPENEKLRGYFRSASLFYSSKPELWEKDFDYTGFEWICPDESDKNIIAFIRRGESERDLIFVCNFSGARENFLMGVPENGTYRTLFSSDSALFGGAGDIEPGMEYKARDTRPCHGREQAVTIDLPPLCGVFLELVPGSVRPRRIVKKADTAARVKVIEKTKRVVGS